MSNLCSDLANNNFQASRKSLHSPPTSAARTSRRTLSAWTLLKAPSTECTSTSTSLSTAPNSTPSSFAKAKSWADALRDSDKSGFDQVAKHLCMRRIIAALHQLMISKLTKTQTTLIHIWTKRSLLIQDSHTKSRQMSMSDKVEHPQSISLVFTAYLRAAAKVGHRSSENALLLARQIRRPAYFTVSYPPTYPNFKYRTPYPSHRPSLQFPAG